MKSLLGNKNEPEKESAISTFCCHHTASVMAALGDDELGQILKLIRCHGDRKPFSLVCKQWMRVEGLIRSSIRVFESDYLRRLLPRFPNLVSFESSTSIADDQLKFLAETCPKIEVAILNFKKPRGSYDGFVEPSDFDGVGDKGIIALANGCLSLKKVLLRRRKKIGDFGVSSLAKIARNLTYLDLGGCNLITDQSLKAIGSLNSITTLNLQGCSLITDEGLGFLATGSSSRSMKRLFISECDRVTDKGVSLFQRMSCLKEINLSDCGPKITDIGGVALAAIPALKRLNMAWLINVSDSTIIALAENCRSLKAMDLTGCELVSGAGIRAFSGHGSLEELVMASCFNINGDDIEQTVLGCRTLKHIVMEKGLRMWIPNQMIENLSRFCDFHWR